jgi:LPXTG-motif cell wall-anchored protein
MNDMAHARTDEINRRRIVRAIATTLAAAMAFTVVTTGGPSAPIAVADTIPIDPTPIECDPADFPDLPFDPCEVLGGGGTPAELPPACTGTFATDARRNDRAVVVQKFNLSNPSGGPDVTISGVPVCLLEQNVIAEIAEERGVELNAEERDEILAFGRDEVRTRLFMKLIAIQERVNAGETVSALERGALTWAQTLNLATQRAIAQAAVDEYAKWKAAPCDYEPPAPHQYVPDFDPGCTGGLAGVFTSVTPPSYTEFAAYGYAAYTGELQLGSTIASGEMSASLTAGLAAALVGAGVFGSAVGTFSIAFPFVTALKALVFVAKSVGTASLGGGFAVLPVIVIALTVATIIRAVQVFEQAAIEGQLNDDLAAANASTGELDIARFLPTFAEATTPRFAPTSEVRTSSTPDPTLNAPYFVTTQEGTSTLSQEITFSSGGETFAAWLSDGWWVVEPLSAPGERTLLPYLTLHDTDGNPEQFISFVDGRIGVVDLTTDEPDYGITDSFSATAPRRSSPANPSDLVTGTFRLAGPLVVDLPASITVDEGEEATFTGIASSAESVDIEVTGGPTPIALSTPTDARTGAFSTARQFTDDGSFSVRITPVAGAAIGPANTLPLTVRNVAPTIDSTSMTINGFAFGTVAAETGDTIALSVDFADAPGAIENHTVTVDWGDGTSSSITGTPGGTNRLTHRYAVSGEQTIEIEVSDGTDAVTTTRTLDVINRPRVVGLSIPGGGIEGVPVTISGQIVGTVLAESGIQITVGGQTTSYPVSPLTGEFSIDLVFPDETFEIIDVEAFGESGQLSNSTGLDLFILNAVPTIGDVSVLRVPGAGPIFAGEEAELALDFSDTGVVDTHTVTVSWGDGTSEIVPVANTGVATRRPSAVHAWTTPGTYTVDIEVRDDSGAAVDTTVEVEIVDPITTTTTTPPSTDASTTTAGPTTTDPSTTTAGPTTTDPSSTTAGPTTTDPSTTTAGPTTTAPGPTIRVSSSQPMTPNRTIDLTVETPQIQAGRTYRGIVRSTPFEVGPTLATVDGSITFTGVVLPADWDAGEHTVTLIDVTSSATEAVVTFTVDDDGIVVAAAPGAIPIAAPITTPSAPAAPTPTPVGSLPSTGGESLPVTTVAMLLLLLGIALAAAARRRTTRGVRIS